MEKLIQEIKEKVLMKLGVNIREFMIIGKNPNSPAGKNDDRDWYMCELCDYANLSKQGITMHLAKYHHISSSQNKEKIIEVSIEEALKFSNKLISRLK